jgi:hypothetical protein
VRFSQAATLNFNNIGDTQQLQVNCSNGGLVLGGGGEVPSGTANIAMTASFPVQTGPSGSWQVRFTKVAGSTQSVLVTVWVLCSA